MLRIVSSTTSTTFLLNYSSIPSLNTNYHSGHVPTIAHVSLLFALLLFFEVNFFSSKKLVLREYARN